MKSKERKMLFIVFMTVLLISWLYLFYRQASLPPNYTRIGMKYGSDMSFHIKVSIENSRNYSIYLYLLGVINKFSGGINPVGTALFLTTIVFLGCLTNYYFFRLYSFKRWSSAWLAILLVFTASIAVPFVFPFFYYGQFDTQPWHNGTYLMMRLFILPMLIQYFDIKNKYMDYIPWRNLVLFIIYSCLCCGSKPSFIIVFYPVMFVGLLCDLEKNGLPRIFNILIFGISVFPSMAVLLYQYILSFTGQVAVADQTGIYLGVMGSVGEVIVSNVLKLIFGLAFPLYVLWGGQWKGLKKIEIRTSFAIYCVAFLEKLLIHESGRRAADGNFGWGVLAAAYILFAYSLRDFFGEFKSKEKWDRIFGICLLSSHYLTGIIYYVLVLLGEEAPSLL